MSTTRTALLVRGDFSLSALLLPFAGSTSYRKAEGETTEWDDILKAKGVLPLTEVSAYCLLYCARSLIRTGWCGVLTPALPPLALPSPPCRPS